MENNEIEEGEIQSDEEQQAIIHREDRESSEYVVKTPRKYGGEDGEIFSGDEQQSSVTLKQREKRTHEVEKEHKSRRRDSSREEAKRSRAHEIAGGSFAAFSEIKSFISGELEMDRNLGTGELSPDEEHEPNASRRHREKVASGSKAEKKRSKRKRERSEGESKRSRKSESDGGVLDEANVKNSPITAPSDGSRSRENSAQRHSTDLDEKVSIDKNRDYEREAVQFFVNKLAKFGPELQIKCLLGHRSRAAHEIRLTSGKCLEDFCEFLSSHPDYFIVDGDRVRLKNLETKEELAERKSGMQRKKTDWKANEVALNAKEYKILLWQRKMQSCEALWRKLNSEQEKEYEEWKIEKEDNRNRMKEIIAEKNFLLAQKELARRQKKIRKEEKKTIATSAKKTAVNESLNDDEEEALRAMLLQQITAKRNMPRDEMIPLDEAHAEQKIQEDQCEQWNEVEKEVGAESTSVETANVSGEEAKDDEEEHEEEVCTNFLAGDCELDVWCPHSGSHIGPRQRTDRLLREEESQ